MKAKILIVILIIGLLTACGNQPTEAPASVSQPTEKPASPTEVPTTPPPPIDIVIPTDTAVPTMESPTTPVASTTVSYANDIFPLMKSRCGNCHGGNKVEEDLNILTYADLMKGSKNGPVIVPGDASNSLLVDLITKLEMPKKGPKLTPPQIQLITDWVNQGALDN